MAELWPDSSFYFIVHELTHFKEDLSLADICNIGYNMGLKLSGPMQLSKRKVGSLKEAVDFIYKRAWRWLFSNSACRLDKSPQVGLS